MATGISSVDQQAVIDYLANPESHGLKPGDHVSCIQTHGALVFLAGQFAYKLKRAVRLPYLDFFTLDKRRAVCRHYPRLLTRWNMRRASRRWMMRKRPSKKPPQRGVAVKAFNNFPVLVSQTRTVPSCTPVASRSLGA